MTYEILRYKILCHRGGGVESTLRSLEREVNELIGEGWQPCGSVIFDSKYEFIMQSMILTKEAEAASYAAEADARQQSLRKHFRRILEKKWFLDENAQSSVEDIAKKYNRKPSTIRGWFASARGYMRQLELQGLSREFEEYEKQHSSKDKVINA